MNKKTNQIDPQEYDMWVGTVAQIDVEEMLNEMWEEEKRQNADLFKEGDDQNEQS